MDELMEHVYDDLRRMARVHLRRHFGGRADHVTLEPAALVNESFMKLIKQRTKYDNRGHFFSIATRMMIRTLIDYRRRRGAAKRGGRGGRGSDAAIAISFSDHPVEAAGDQGASEVDLDALMDVVAELEDHDSRKADVMKMRIVWGLTNDEIAAALGISKPTVERDWRFAKAWLSRRIDQGG